MDKCNESERALMGRLMYLSVHTKSDLSFAPSCLSQFSNEPKIMHISALKRVLRYLKGTINYQLKFGKKKYVRKVEYESNVSWNRTRDTHSLDCWCTEIEI